jgi:hypothetical protein
MPLKQCDYVVLHGAENPAIRWNEAPRGIESEKDEFGARLLEVRRIDGFGRGVSSTDKLKKKGKEKNDALYLGMKGSHPVTGQEVSLNLLFDSPEEREWFFERWAVFLNILAKGLNDRTEKEELIKLLETKIDNVSD